MAGSTIGLERAIVAQLGLESAKGTLVAATHKWLGPVTIQPDTLIQIPRYNKGILGEMVPEDTYVMREQTVINLADAPFSVEQAAYIYNMAIKAAAASGVSTPWLLDAFTFPTDASSINDFSTFTWEWSNGIQEYECGYVFCEKFSVHGDENSDGGEVKLNAVLRGRKRTASTITASLNPITVIQPLNLIKGSVKIDALGTVAGTAAATSNLVKAFNIDVVSGLQASEALDGRTDLDYGIVYYGGNHKVTGKLSCLFNSVAVTQIANARTPTGIVLQIALAGTGTRAAKYNLPIAWTKDPEFGTANRKGMHVCEFEFEAGYSTTATAQGISMPLNMSASTTIT